MSHNDLRRQATHDIELGAADALQKHITRHVVQPRPVSARKLRYEHARPRILREMLGEATGVFFYVFCGVASVASFTLATTNPVAVGASGTPGIGVTVFGSLFQIGLAFAFGIAFAIITCAQVSGGHFNPAITICFAVWQGFPWKKVPHYIFSQIFGAFMAGLMVLACYWPEIQAAKAIDIAEHGTVHYNGGVASILCPYPNPNQTNQGFLFLQEFFVDSCIAIIIWSCLDPANPFMSPTVVPWAIGLGYAVMVWGFAGNTISTNLARDLGPRLVDLIFFGKGAFTLDNGYSWISILVNVPATLFGTAYYEMVIRDSIIAVAKGDKRYEGGEEGMREFVRTVTRDEAVAGAMSSVGGNKEVFDDGAGVRYRGSGENGSAEHHDGGVPAKDAVINGRDWA